MYIFFDVKNDLTKPFDSVSLRYVHVFVNRTLDNEVQTAKKQKCLI